MKKLLLTLALCMGYLCTTVAQTFVKTEVKQSMRLGNRNYWQVNQRMYHADDICVSQMYLYMYEKYKRKSMLVPTQARAEWVIANPPSGSFELDYGDATTLEHWTWCDALFMAPPVYMKLYNITGDKKFIRFMD